MKQQLSRSQVLMIGSAFALDSTIISKPGLLIRDLASDFWIGMLVSLAYGMAAVLVFTALASRFPRKDFIDGVVGASPVAGRMVAGAYVLFFLGILVRDIRASSDFIKIALLPETPLTVIAGCLGLCLIAIARHGKLSVARMSQLWQPLLIVLAVFLPLLLGLQLNVQTLLPVFQHSPREIAAGGAHLIAYTGEAVGVVMIASYRPWMRKFNMYSLLLGWATIFLLTLTVVLTLGTEIPARSLYPNYEMIRKVRLTDFLDRFDLPMIGIWLPAMIVKTSFSLYIVSHGLRRIFPALRLPWVAAAIGAASVAAALTAYGNTLQLLRFDRVWTPISVVFQLALPALLLLFFRRKRARSAPSPEAEAD